MIPPKEVKVGKVKFGNKAPIVLIAGPCVIESRDLIHEVAGKIKEKTNNLGLQFIFKSSFDKANRTSMHSFRGPGMEKGLLLLEEVKKIFGIPVTTDIHLPEQAKFASEVVDLLQIPAFLCRQSDLLIAAAKTKKPVSIKKGQFLAPWDMKSVVEKLREAGSDDVILIERGTTFGYNNLVVDMGGLHQLRTLGCPVVFDATHSVQLPGGQGSYTGGRRELIAPLTRAALGVGVDGIFLEVHPDPEKALSDGPNSLPLDKLSILLEEILELDQLRLRRERQ
ncbi:MAG: 3-deoxy-8-phosphooctulonate synthase [Deltaproteobacteria bacterium RIFCSPHIGHO2_12_FULL_43_9]|nr:MAG: 3-deoxy-8-phosphooctulonate synthase [Deltaproteobacteria bacterium RIFCSPHIGHO2_12_FULL_43_9]